MVQKEGIRAGRRPRTRIIVFGDHGYRAYFRDYVKGMYVIFGNIHVCQRCADQLVEVCLGCSCTELGLSLYSPP